MERDLPRDRSISLKKRVTMSTLLAASLTYGLNEIGTAGHDNASEVVYPPELFHPVTVPESNKLDKEIIPYSKVIVEFPKPTPTLSKAEKRELKTKKELAEIVSIMKDHPDSFKKKYIKDVKIYYPIYKAVADKYDIDWYLLFIVHERETGASAGKRGFAASSYYKGAMQRDPQIWPQSYVDKAARGLEYLKKLPQRHKTDWKEIAAAGRMLSANEHLYENKGNTKSTSVLKALLRYSAEGPARTRYDMFKKYDKYFDKVS